MSSGEAGGLPQQSPTNNNLNDNKVAPSNAEADQPEQTRQTVSKASAIILVLAIGVHAFFEGIAFGLQATIEKAF